MDSTRITQWNFDGIKLIGNSVAGVGTCLVWPELGVAFDTAQGLPHAFAIPVFLISHAHMDHAAGIPYLISQKAMTSQRRPRFYMPGSMVEPMEKILKTWQEMEGHQYTYEFIATELGKEYALKGNYFFRAFPTLHRVASNGFTVFERRKKLDPKWQSASADEIVRAKARGEDVECEVEIPLLSYTGDTQIEFLDLAPEVRKSKVLVQEVTYIDEKRPVERARKWGHIHWNELRERLDEIDSEKILLIHLSARYSTAQFNQLLDKELSPQMRNRVEVFPRPERP